MWKALLLVAALTVAGYAGFRHLERMGEAPAATSAR